MAQPISIVTTELARRLRAESGLSQSIATVALLSESILPAIPPSNVMEQYVAAEVAEKAAGVMYPAVYVYCDRAVNNGREKFRTFSGTADLTVEVRVSHDHVDKLQTQLQLYIEAITDVLDRNRGTWAEGVYVAGNYEIAIAPVKRGGKNFLQAAKLRIEVHINLN